MSLHRPVLFIGDKPNPKKNLSMDVPFVGTQSYKVLLEWCFRMDVDVRYINYINAYTVDGRRSEELRVLLPNYLSNKIVALGANAAERLDVLNLVDVAQIKFFRLPHPSGLNRETNDKKKLTELLSRCREYIYKEKL